MPADPRKPALAALRDKLVDAKARGHNYVQIVKWSGNSPRNWERARIVSGRPSLMGRCIGAGHICGQWRFDVRVEDLERWLDGVEKRHAG
jgi:hypothetical protein